MVKIDLNDKREIDNNIAEKFGKENNFDFYEVSAKEGKIKNWNKEGKGVYYYKNGDIYEGDFKNDFKEGKGVFYYKNGDREMGDYLKDIKAGKHITLHPNGKISQKVY